LAKAVGTPTTIPISLFSMIEVLLNQVLKIHRLFLLAYSLELLAYREIHSKLSAISYKLFNKNATFLF